MSRKRKADDAPQVVDEKLQRVERALANVARTGATFVCGAIERFPLPAISFRDKRGGHEDDEADDLLLPLRKRDLIKLKACGSVSQQHEGVKVSWDVDGALLESRNPKWHEFLDEWLTSQRARLGIAPAAQVEMKLSKMVLAEAGARLDPRREGEARGTGAFGRLLVVLPGTFAGGSFVTEQPRVWECETEDDETDGEGDGGDGNGDMSEQDDDEEDDDEEQDDDEEDDDEERDDDENHHEQDHDQDEDNGEADQADNGNEGEEAQDDDDDSDAESEESQYEPLTPTVTWEPAMRGNDFGIAYAAFYDSCEYVSEPVGDGTALCLVYDLTTTTPSEVPLFAGTTLLQQSVTSALVGYFDVSPSPLAKRLKLASDTWRVIRDFIAQRQFVYPVGSVSANWFFSSEHKISVSLAAFCESSGQYVLYHAPIFCSEYCPRDTFFFRDEKVKDNKMSATLGVSWTKHGTSETFNYPPITLRYQYEVANSRLLESAEFNAVLRDITATKSLQTRLSELYRNWRNAKFHVISALVVMPVSIETSQFGKLPLQDVADKLKKVFSQSREEALAYERRVVYHRADWHLSDDQMRTFEEIVKIVIEIDDLQLFTDLLLVVHLKTPVNELASGVEKFGWDACADALVKSIRSTPTFRGRVCLILSVCYERMRSEHVNQLIDTLLSLHPWTDVKIGRRASGDASWCTPDETTLTKLLAVTRVHCAERIQDIISFSRAEELIGLAMPALTRFSSEELDEPEMRAALHRVWELFQPMLVTIRNEPYAQVRIPEHCRKCQELQRFFVSEATETTVEVSEDSEVEHLSAVLQSEANYPAVVAVTRQEDNKVLLVKTPGHAFTWLSDCAEDQEKRFRKLLFQDDAASVGEMSG